MPSSSLWSVLAILCVAAGTASPAVQSVPMFELSGIDAKTSTSFGNILTVRQLSGGKVLVNDGKRRQLVLLDSTLGNRTIVIDSFVAGSPSYGRGAARLIPYVADSSLFIGGAAPSLIVIGLNGRMAHPLAGAKLEQLRWLVETAAGIDAKGNLLSRARPTVTRAADTAAAASTASSQLSEFVPVVRINLRTGGIDTLSRIYAPSSTHLTIERDASGRVVSKILINPLPMVDDWAVLSDGTVAFIRGQDYHVDLVHPNGSTTSVKLPFEWRRLSDPQKERLVDSVKRVLARARANVTTDGGALISTGSAGNAAARSQRASSVELSTATIESVPFRQIGDRYPAIRTGAALADRDGNLWILTTRAAPTDNSGLVYDVVSNRGLLRGRVRVGEGRSIAGFGRNGIVYLKAGSDASGWRLERATIASRRRATS